MFWFVKNIVSGKLGTDGSNWYPENARTREWSHMGADAVHSPSRRRLRAAECPPTCLAGGVRVRTSHSPWTTDTNTTLAP